jgi:hypothetical protein
MYPSDEIVVLVYSDEVLISVDVILEVVGGQATSVGAMSPADSADYGWDPGFTFDPIGTPGESVEICAATFSGAPPGEVGYFLLHGEGSGQITLRLRPGDSCGGASIDIHGQEAAVSGEIVIYQISEPNCWDETECPCQPYGDGSCNGRIDLADLFALKAHFGKCAPWTGSECCSDYDHDGCVELPELYRLKASWGWVPDCTSTGNQNCP